MASKRYIPLFFFVVVVVLFSISWYTYSYHEDVHDYKSSYSIVYAWYMNTVGYLMFQDLDVFENLALASTNTFDVDSFGAKGDGKKDDTKVHNIDHVSQHSYNM